MALFGNKKKKDEQKKDETQAEQRAESVSIVLPPGASAGAYRVITQSHISEKSSMLASLNKYEFRVPKNATRVDVRHAIQKLYKVKVIKVNVRNMPSKTRQIGKYMGTKSGFKKAIVTLVKGDKIDVV